ncbi:hypothetical protein PMAN_a1483 [Pseudoalteromonas marina]|nr:hypothetical protein PMAN_a1483 [Pseudoalteromonas marina]
MAYLIVLFICTVLVFYPLTLLKVVLVYFNNERFKAYVIICLH